MKAVAIIALLAVTFLAAVCLGERVFGPADVLEAIRAGTHPDALSDLPAPARIVLVEIRIPRAVLALLVGSSLAVAGVLMQGLFRNPLGDPGIIGISAGGALGAVVAIALGTTHMLAVPAASLAGSAVTAALAVALSLRGGKASIAGLLLSGIAINALATSLTSLIMVLSQSFLLRDILGWLMGSLDARTWSHVRIALPFALAGIGGALWVARELDLLAGGEEVAASLGVDVRRTRLLVLFFASLAAGGAVAVSGIIGFVGIVVPHVMRGVVGPAHARLIPASAAGGALLLLAADTVSRMAPGGGAVRLGILTSLLGVPFFLGLVRGSGRRDNYA